MDIPTEKFISALLFNPQLWIQETVENHDHPCPFRTWHVKRESSTALAIHICKLFYTHSYIHVVPFIKKWQTFPPSIPPSLFNFFFFYVSLVQDDNNKRVMTFKMVKKTNLQFVTRTKSIPQISSQAHCKTLANLLQVKFSQDGKKKTNKKTSKTANYFFTLFRRVTSSLILSLCFRWHVLHALLLM